MKPEEFTLHDVSRFPLVVLFGRELPRGYGPTWVREFDVLLSQGSAFALLFPNSAEQEDHEDQKLRALFLKANKARLAERCVGIFSVEPDMETRLAKRAQGKGLAAALGIRFRIAATLEEAERLASLALAGLAVPDDVEGN